jgi:drug/metabolite transporter (DMT)-like permease
LSSGALLLGEPLGPMRIAAAVLVLAGLAVVALPWRARGPARAETPQGSGTS